MKVYVPKAARKAIRAACSIVEAIKVARALTVNDDEGNNRRLSLKESKMLVDLIRQGDVRNPVVVL